MGLGVLQQAHYKICRRDGRRSEVRHEQAMSLSTVALKGRTGGRGGP